MKKLVLSLLSALVLVPMSLAACGGESDDPSNKFQDSCKTVCEKYVAADCDNTVPADQCGAACEYLEEQVGVCLEEYAEAYSCLADLNYTCNEGYPYPDDLDAAFECVELNQKAAECMEGIECKNYCAAAAKAGCGGASETQCVQECEAGVPQDDFCDSDYYRFRECQSQNLTCGDGKPSSEGCENERDYLIECLSGFGSDGDPCVGFCFLAVDEGCASGTESCLASCQAALTPPISADDYYCDYITRDLQTCEASGLSCQNGTIAIGDVDCKSQQQSMASCLADYYSVCQGECWYAENLGCPKGDTASCQQTCEAEIAAAGNCQYELEYVKKCKINNNLVCGGDSSACQYEEESYQTCLTNNP